ncbi:MAG TPA: SGNH/GDSL hydrolase family protein [Ferruginibacter sp.]|nr:SGNH/GDSL hydrolase family protein [Ferruginibacter sp.]
MKTTMLVIYFFMMAAISCKQQQEINIAFNDSQLAYDGRIRYTNEAAILSWPGSAIHINFSGTEIKGSFSESDTANYYNVIIDGKIISRMHFDKERKTYTLASGLENRAHSLKLFKRTEWDKGSTSFYSFSGKDLKILPPPAKPKRKIEFYGNSISCGYAIEDLTTDMGIGFFENNYNAFPAVTARHFNAQYSCIAKSGIGITVSWFPLLMKEMYNRLNPEDSGSKWDFSQYTPDIVVINLMQNDYWITNMPDNDQFKLRFGNKKPTSDYIIGEYKSFVQSVRTQYPAAKIICMLGNMDITSKGSLWPGYVATATGQLNDKNVFNLVVPYKNTPGHPRTDEQKILADSLVAFIDKNIVW